MRRTETDSAVETIPAAVGERAPSFDSQVSEAAFGDFEERIASESLTAVVEVLWPAVAEDSSGGE